MAKLVVTAKSLAGLSHELDTHWVTIGRSPTNKFTIPDTSVSGQHCEVQARGDELVIRDMRSTNGTYVKGGLIAQSVIKLGESFRVGEVEIWFEVSEPAKVVARISAQPRAAASNTDSAGNSPAVLTNKKHQVLLVDDSMAFLETMGETFESISNHSWEIHRASSADTALFLLQQHPIELAVVDINMPMLDGVQLLRVIQRRHPDVKKVVLTGLANEANRSNSLANGAELFLEKPVSASGISSVYNLLNDLFVWNQRDGFSGTLRQVGLPDVIQIECLRRSSCILDVHNPEGHGSIYIESGAIVHAATGNLVGEPALFQLLGLRNGEFRLKAFTAPSTRSISGSWELLLMEAARVSDEQKGPESSSDTVYFSQVAENSGNEAAPAPFRIPVASAATPHVDPVEESDLMMPGYDGDWHPMNGSKK